MQNHMYVIRNTEEIITPSLIYYKDILRENINKMISVAGDVNRLWPHVKSHKMAALVSMQIEMGITKFKCATVAEAQMAAECGASELILAYPLIGPNIERFLRLTETYPKTKFWAIGDDFECLRELGEKAQAHKAKVNVLIDVNMGTNRTGVKIENIFELYEKCHSVPGLLPDGLHCYDGNHGIENYEERQAAVEAVDQRVFRVVEQIEEKGMRCGTLVMGGTPSFPCHAKYRRVFLSPGTGIISDYGYAKRFTDEHFVPAGILMTRVISHPEKGYFTLDLGYKGIAADPQGARGKLLGVEHAVSVNQNEEHWIWKMEEGKESLRPAIGTVLYVIPTHICPTSALYPQALVAQNGEIVDQWEVNARNRKITI